MDQNFKDISLTELDLFVKVAKIKSIRESARQLKMTAGAASKVIQRIEKKLQKDLLRRSQNGILLTSDGFELLKTAEKILAQAGPLSLSKRTTEVKSRVWTVASLSFICSRVLSHTIDEITSNRKNTQFRLLEIGNSQLVGTGLSGAFEIAVHIGLLEWTRTWSTHQLANMRWGLYAKKDHKLFELNKVKSADVVNYPFVVPTFWTNHGFIRGDDNCPLNWDERKIGHEASTGETALEIVSNTDNLTFVPYILAKRLVQQNLIKEIFVSDWPVVEKTIYISIRDDLVPSSLLDSLIKNIKKNLV